MRSTHCGVTFSSITSQKLSIASNAQTSALLLCLQCKKFGLGTPDIAKHCVVGPLLPGTKVKTAMADVARTCWHAVAFLASFTALLCSQL